jgi:hypothetical protein
MLGLVLHEVMEHPLRSYEVGGHRTRTSKLRDSHCAIRLEKLPTDQIEAKEIVG